MKTTIKHIAIFIVTFALIFTSLPMEAHAVSTPPKVKTFTAKTHTTTSVRLTWKKPGKASGYAIYVNGKLNKNLSMKNTAYNVPNLRPGTAYKVSIRTYNTYKQKQYYNSKTRKWQTRKPSASQWKGKRTRKVNARKYSKASVVRTVKTKAAAVPTEPAAPITPTVPTAPATPTPATPAPDTPANLSVFESAANTIRIQWTKNSSNTTGYEVYLNGEKKCEIGSGGNIYGFRNLSANTSYQIKIRAFRVYDDTVQYSDYAVLTASTTIVDPINNGGIINTATPPPTLPSGKNTTGGVYDQTPETDFSVGSLKWRAVEWAKANIPNNATDGEKASLIMNSVFDNFSDDIPVAGRCVVAATIAIYMLDYVGIESVVFDIYRSNGFKWGASMHVCNLMWIKGKPYVVDAAMPKGASEYANTNTYETNENIDYANGGVFCKSYTLRDL